MGCRLWGRTESDTTEVTQQQQQQQHSVFYFPGGSDGKESAYNAEDLGLILGLGRSPGEGNNYSFQYSGLENSMDRGAWQGTVHGVTETRT